MRLAASMVFLRFTNRKKFAGRANADTIAGKRGKENSDSTADGANHPDKTLSIIL